MAPVLKRSYFKKKILSLSILASMASISSCTLCDHKDDMTLYPQCMTGDIRFPLNKGEASVGITLSYSLSEKRMCELNNQFGENYTNELIMGHTRQAVGERLQYKKFSELVKSEEWQEKKLTKELSHYFSCFDIHIFSVDLMRLRREPDCILTHSPSLAPGCYDYAGVLREKE